MLTALPSFADIAGLSGYALIAVVCVLLIVEEVGVPLFFAPGDLLLVASGAAISAAHLNPLLVVAATTSSVLVGALAGRELFARVGYPAAARIAGLLHIRGGLDRLVTRVRRGGAAAVFAGRITPGLRVHTTEAAGLVRMRRTTFVSGLVPAVLLYEAVFAGLGVWQGRAAWSLVQTYSPNPLVVVGLLGAAVGSLLTGHLLVRRLRRRTPRRDTAEEV